MFDEYNKLPSKIWKELPFIDYMDFHPKLQNKNDLAKKKYYELSQDLLAKEQLCFTRKHVWPFDHIWDKNREEETTQEVQTNIEGVGKYTI